MPVLGLGVWQMDEGAETENAVEWALEAGSQVRDRGLAHASRFTWRACGEAVLAGYESALTN